MKFPYNTFTFTLHAKFGWRSVKGTVSPEGMKL